MASKNNIYIASLTIVILLIQTHMCSFSPVETIVELDMSGRKFILKSSDVKTFRERVCSSSYTFYQFKSGELITQNISQSELPTSSHRNIECWYYLVGHEQEGFKCNQSTSSFTSATNNQTAYMHFDCGNTCVDIVWVGVLQINAPSATRGKCADGIGKAISAAGTTKDFISATFGQPNWRTSAVPSTTSTIVPLFLAGSTSNVSTEVSLDPALPTSTTVTKLPLDQALPTSTTSTMVPLSLAVSTSNSSTEVSLDPKMPTSTTSTIFPLDPTLPTSNTISIIAIIVCACTVLLILGLVIMYFAMKRNTEKHQHMTYNRFVQRSSNIIVSDVHSDGGNSTQGRCNLDMQRSLQHATTSVVCTITPSDTSATRRDNVATVGSAWDDSNPINVYAILREQLNNPSDTYDTLANVMDDLGGSMGTTSADTINLRGDAAESVIANEEDSNATNIYAAIRGQPSHTTETCDILRNVDKKVNPKICRTNNNSDRITSRQGTVDKNVLIHEFQLTDVGTDNTLIRRGILPSLDSPVYSVVMKQS